jgi:hypothetical protein
MVRKERMDNNGGRGVPERLPALAVVRLHVQARGHDERVFKDFTADEAEHADDVIEALRANVQRPGVAPVKGRGGKLLTDDAWIDTVRIARDLGDVSAVLPEGIEAP